MSDPQIVRRVSIDEQSFSVNGGGPSSRGEETKDVEANKDFFPKPPAEQHGSPSSTGTKTSSIMQSQGVTLHFHKLVLTAQIISRQSFKPKTKRILKGISGIAKQGTVTALMGPSGCGKTSLLHTLAGKNRSSTISGHILVDGKPRDEGFHHKIGYVEQDDMLMGVLTVKENLMFSAELRLPTSISKKNKQLRVDDTIELLGLWKCSNTKIGTNLIRGVSGGERKRCSIGMELVVDPAVLFLDEPTSGLDANTAQNVVQILADLAREGKTVILSIHQPRYSVFRLFDNLMLLGEGEMLYQGSPEHGLEYFKKLDFVCEPYNNPADFFMDVVASQISMLQRSMSLGGTVTVEERGYLARSFLKSEEGKNITHECQLMVLNSGGSTLVEQKVAKHVRRYATGFLQQTFVISKRAITAVVRNPETSVMQILAFILSALIVGTFYHGQLTNYGLDDRVGCMFVISYMVIFGQLTSIELFIQERALFIHEKTSGFYRTSAYFLAKVCCEIIPTRIVPTLFFALISAFMIGLRTDPTHLAIYWLTLTATNLASTSLCLMVSAMVPVYSVGFLIAALFNVFFMISSGFLLNTTHMPPFLLPFKYMSIFRYNLNVLLTLDLHDRKFDCSKAYVNKGTPSLCLPEGDMYLDSKGIDADALWDNIMALFLMVPCYLFLAYVVLRNLKKSN